MTPVVNVLLDTLVLKSGSHAEASREMCVMEAVAFVAGEPWTDSPVCASEVIAGFMRSWNDAILDDAHRTELLAPLVPRLIDTRGTSAVEMRRSWLAFDWLARVQAPAWMDLVEATKPHAVAVRALAPLASRARVEAASASLFAARDCSSAAGDAAWAAARDAARAAAWAAAWAAARAAAGDAARDAAGAAAWAAAWAAAGAAAGDAARAAAWAAARAAAWAAAGDAARDAAWDAAWAAAWDALRPTVSALEQSALELVDRMLAVTPEMPDDEFEALCQWTPLVVERG